jgi:hypothetical protein
MRGCADPDAVEALERLANEYKQMAATMRDTGAEEPEMSRAATDD